MIPLFKVAMEPEAGRDVERVLRSGYIGQGAIVEEFEAKLSALYDGRPVITTNSCTSAIQLALRFLGVGPRDEVITTPLTCIATNAPIVAMGARPVWADVDEYGLVDVEKVEKLITYRTYAVIVVNWTGRQVDLSKLREVINRKHGYIPIIVDAAHGPLNVSPLADFTCLSFGPIKHLTCGDGGAVVLGGDWNDKFTVDDMKLLRWYGLNRESTADFRCEQDIVEPGMKWHMNDINAAIGLANLEALKYNVHRHKRNAAYLYDNLRNVPTIALPDFDPSSDYWVFPLRVLNGRRDELKKHLEANLIQASQVHARNDKHTGYQFYSGPLPGLDAFDAEQLNIPCGWWISEGSLAAIVKAVKDFV